MKFNTISSPETADLMRDKVVLVRADLNVPMQDGEVSDTTRLDRLIPTLRLLQERNAKIVVMSHFGRPKGKKTAEDSLAPVAKKLGALLGEQVLFVSDCIGDAVHMNLSTMKPKDIAVLENLRFYTEEEENEPDFARQLAELGDLYVNDAFSASHRAHASIDLLARKLPAYAGLLMEAELTALQDGLENPQHPVATVIGGAKISTKLSVLHNLVKKMDVLILGGGMANTFLAAKGISIGASLCEHDMKDEANRIMKQAEEAGCRIFLPADVVVAKELAPNTPSRMISLGDIAEDDKALDIGTLSIIAINSILDTCKTVLWNGPLGAFEIEPFDEGTIAVGRHIAALTMHNGLVSVAGGGDTVAALERAGITDMLTYVSAAGGAFLEWMEGKTLPGVQALCDSAATHH